MERPGFVAMIQELEEGHAAAVFVKDMSRFGRNYIEVGKLTEDFLPDHDIRLVAVSDNVDTAEGENELTPIRNLFNEWYARDISKNGVLAIKSREMPGNQWDSHLTVISRTRITPNVGLWTRKPPPSFTEFIR